MKELPIMRNAQDYKDYMVSSLRNDNWTVASKLDTGDGEKYTLSNAVDGCMILVLMNWGECTFYGLERDILLFDSSAYELRDEGILRDYGKYLDEIEEYFNWKSTPQEVVMNALAEDFVVAKT